MGASFQVSPVAVMRYIQNGYGFIQGMAEIFHKAMNSILAMAAHDNAIYN